MTVCSRGAADATRSLLLVSVLLLTSIFAQDVIAPGPFGMTSEVSPEFAMEA
jgi:hypothetical protein